MRTAWHRFLGLNIKGTPAMRAEAVEHDLEVARDRASVVVVQEFRWHWYWRTLRRVLRAFSERRWRSAPRAAVGILRPTFAGQAVLWRGSGWQRLDTMCRLLHQGKRKVTESRWLRAVLLAEDETGLAAWYGTTHFVVRGDERDDPLERQRLLRHDLDELDGFLADLVATGHPVLFQLDANIRPGTPAYRLLLRILGKHGATLHGQHGVEYLFTIDGDDVEVQVLRDWTIPTSRLRTDHEGRGITYRLRTKGLTPAT